VLIIDVLHFRKTINQGRGDGRKSVQQYINGQRWSIVALLDDTSISSWQAHFSALSIQIWLLAK